MSASRRRRRRTPAVPRRDRLPPPPRYWWSQNQGQSSSVRRWASQASLPDSQCPRMAARNDLAEVVGLARADAFHRRAARRCERGCSARHLAQRRVVEDDVRRHAARRARSRAAPRAGGRTASRSTSCHDSASTRDCGARRVLARRRAGAPASDPGTLRLVLQQRRRPSPSAQHRIRIVGLLQQAEAGRAARCSRAPRRPTRRGSRPNVLSLSWPRATHLLAGVAAQHAGDVRRRRSAGRRARRTTGSCAPATTGSAAGSSSSRQ